VSTKGGWHLVFLYTLFRLLINVELRVCEFLCNYSSFFQSSCYIEHHGGWGFHKMGLVDLQWICWEPAFVLVCSVQCWWMHLCLEIATKNRDDHVSLSAMCLLLVIGCNTGASVVENVHCWCRRWLKIYDWRRYLIDEISSIGIQCWNTEVQIRFWSFMKKQNENMPFRFWAISSCMLVIEERKGKICRLWNSCWGFFLFRTV
jgi:hypothetical protein